MTVVEDVLKVLVGVAAGEHGQIDQHHNITPSITTTTTTNKSHNTHLSDEIPRLGPAKPLEIHEHAHQFRDQEGRVGVVHLERNLIRKCIPVVVALLVPPNDVLNRRGDEEVLLFEPQLLAFVCPVVRIKHRGKGLCPLFGQDGLRFVGRTCGNCES